MNHPVNQKDKNKAVAETFSRRVWVEKDVDAVDDLIHAKCVIHSSIGDFQGPESMKKLAHTFLQAFPDLIVKNIAVICDQDLVAIHWQVHGTHRGEISGIPPTGKSVSYSGVTIYQIKNDKITSYWAYNNMLQVLQQIHLKV